MRITLIIFLLLCQLVTAYFTWANYKLDKDFTDSMESTTEGAVEYDQYA